MFNDIAVAIQFLRKRGLIRRAAVIDLDVHQGDGTAEIFQDDPDVFTLSIHGESNFPFRKKKSRLDVPLPDGVEDAAYLRHLDEVLPAAFGFPPGHCLLSVGRRSSGFRCLSAAFHSRHKDSSRATAWSFHAALSFGAPFVLTSGGGYSRPIELSAEAHANTYRTAWEMFARV